MLRTLYQTVDRRRRPLRDHHYLVLPALGLAYGRCPNAASDGIRQAMATLARTFGEATSNAQSEHPATQAQHAGYATGTLSSWVEGMTLLSARELTRRHPDALIFSAVRDPLARLAACYLRQYGAGRTPPVSSSFLGFHPKMSFAQFALQVCAINDRKSANAYRSQTAILRHNRTLLPRHFIRFESPEPDWQALREKARQICGIDIGALPTCQDASEAEVRKLLTEIGPDVRGAVRKRYRQDYQALYAQS